MMKYSNDYKQALRHVLEIEGAPTDYGWDPGGETAYGISRVYWPQYWHNGKPTFAIAQEFYFKEFWLAQNCHALGYQAVRLELFEACVNCGFRNGGLFLQRAFNLLRLRTWPRLLEDGVVGPVTVAAVNRLAAVYQDALLAGCNYYQAEYYASRAERLQDHAIRGWFAKRLAWDRR